MSTLLEKKKSINKQILLQIGGNNNFDRAGSPLSFMAVNTVKVMSSMSVNQLAHFQSGLSPLSG